MIENFPTNESDLTKEGQVDNVEVSNENTAATYDIYIRKIQEMDSLEDLEMLSKEIFDQKMRLLDKVKLENQIIEKSSYLTNN